MNLARQPILECVVSCLFFLLHFLWYSRDICRSVFPSTSNPGTRSPSQTDWPVLSPVVLKTSLLALSICGHWAGLASRISLISVAAFSWPVFLDVYFFANWYLCFVFCRKSSLISRCHTFWFSNIICVYSFKIVYFSHVQGFWIRVEMFLAHYFNTLFYILLYNCFFLPP